MRFRFASVASLFPSIPSVPSRSLAALVTAAALGAAALGAAACSDDPADPTAQPGADGGNTAEGGSSPGEGGTTPGADGAVPEDDSGSIATDGEVGAPLVVTSPGFTDGQALPAKYSCGPTNANPQVSPPLAWTGGQAGALSYAVVMRDGTLADAFHWVIWDIPGATTSLPEGVARTASPAVPAGAKQAIVAFSSMYGDGAPGFFYACPPIPDGAHTYTFTVYSLPMATLPNVTATSTPDEVAAELGANALDIGTVKATLDR